MEPSGHVQTLPSASSTKLLPFHQELDSASQPENLKIVEDIEADAGFGLLTDKDSDVAVPALSTVSQADSMAAQDDSSSLTGQAHSTMPLTVAPAALAFQMPSLSSNSVLAQNRDLDGDVPGPETVQSSEANMTPPSSSNCLPTSDNAGSQDEHDKNCMVIVDSAAVVQRDGEDMVVDESQERIPNKDEDVESELSDGEDIRADLEAALEDINFSFNGNFYHANVLTTAPNPCLHIAGLGLVGLPLSERDAKAIVSCATLAPFGHGERTVINKEVRDTWEIEPARIVFGNPEWVKYVDGSVCYEVCKALGVSIGNSPPKMELYKLLLYETGSHFLPHQDTQKANGMFATVVILLPSAYTGGQVVVSHASTIKVIDLAPNSLLSTAVLAWYTDVKHEVKPVTSGYRLALSYNLIHVAPPHVPMPTLPEMGNAMTRVSRVLRKWRDERYEELPDMPLLAYLLDHKYSQHDLGQGLKSLKGADAHRVRALRDVAEGLGYVVGLARLEHTVSGAADDDGGSYHCRNRYDCYDEDDEDEDEEDTPGMMEVCDTNTSITGLVDLDGVSLLSFGKINLQESNLVQIDPFDDEEPDHKEYEGYMGNGAGELQYWYRRTVFVLMHRDDVDNVCFSVEGIPYAFQKLTGLGAHNSTVPTADMRLWANRLVLKGDQLNKDQAIKMLDLTLFWRDMEMFKAIIQCRALSVGSLELDTLLNAWKIFTFEIIRSSFEALLSRSTQFSAKINLIYSIKDKASPEEASIVHNWCDKEAHKVLSSYAQADVNDIPTIISIGRLAGWPAFFTILLPKLFSLPDSYQFWIAFTKTVREGRQSILDGIQRSQSSSQSSAEAASVPDVQPAVSSTSLSTMDGFMSALGVASGEKNIADALIDKALQIAAKQWSHAPASYASPAYYTGLYGGHSQNTNVAQKAKVDRIIEIVDLAITNENMEVCRALFVEILKSPGTSATKFVQLYTPVVSRLCPLLTSKKKDFFSAPFVDLFQILIGTYLRDILGKKGQLSNTLLRKIGCGCGDCQSLDNFILNPKTTSETFRLAQARRSHLERQVARASDLCSYQTIRGGSPHGLQVTKRREVVQASVWDYRQKEAKKFLASIGSDSTVSKIMGGRYADVVAAVSGKAWFGAGSTGKSAPAAAPLDVGGHVTAGTSRGDTLISKNLDTTAAASNSSLVNPGSVAGQKRKYPVVDLGVVDLTGDDSS